MEQASHQKVTVEGHVVHVAQTGDARSNQCFVLVHGIGVSMAYFGPLAEKLSTEARVVCIDLPGFGSSSRPKASITIADHARIVGRVIKRLRLPNPILVGHSMGCQIITELDFQQPQLASRLVLIGPTVDPARRSASNHFWRLMNNARFEPKAVNLLIVKDYLRCGPRQYFKTLRPMLEHSIESRLPTRQKPIIIIRGQKDRIISHAWTLAATDMLVYGKLAEIPNAAHAVHYSKADEVAALCLRFIKR
jgi:pimeloyl-ACP methyl ester carboxylesterase